MTTPQDPSRRKKQKQRRAKQLAEWRERKAKASPAPKGDAPAKKA